MRVATIDLNEQELADLHCALRTQISLELRRRANDRHPAVVRFERLRLKIGIAQGGEG